MQVPQLYCNHSSCGSERAEGRGFQQFDISLVLESQQTA